MTVSVDPPPTLTLAVSNPTPKSGDTITVTPAFTAGGNAISDYWSAYGSENTGDGRTERHVGINRQTGPPSRPPSR